MSGIQIDMVDARIHEHADKRSDDQPEDSEECGGPMFGKKVLHSFGSNNKSGDRS